MAWVGLAGALILLATTPAYLRRSLSGQARPHPLSWGIWSALGVLGAVSTTVSGAGAGVIALYTADALTLVIFVVALREHEGAISRGELWPLVPAAIGVLVWGLSRNPLAATIGVVAADTSAFWPTLRKTWLQPRSEPAHLWAADSLAFLCSALAVSDRTLAAMLYPVYLTLGCALLAGVAWLRLDRVADAAGSSARTP